MALAAGLMFGSQSSSSGVAKNSAITHASSRVSDAAQNLGDIKGNRSPPCTSD